MPVVTHQMLMYKNLLSYRTQIEDDIIPQMIMSIPKNISALELEICGDIIITRDSDETEFLIPVDKSFLGNQHYEFKPEFKLVNAVRVRHYGLLKNIGTSLDYLSGYISEHSMTPITNPYFIFKNMDSNIIDVFVGISENIL